MTAYLQGLRVLDFSRLLPGPFASLMLAEMGAEVIKVEDTGVGDPARMAPPLIEGRGALYESLNVGKKNLSIDLKHPKSREVIWRLVKHYDVVLEGFRPGTMAGFGLSYEDLREVNPEIIYCSLTGYGQQGAFATRAGHDLNFQALVGLVEMTGVRNGAPAMPGTQMSDLAGSYAAVLSILAAVFRRMRTGEGEHLDVSMCDGQIALMPIQLAEVMAQNQRPARGETLLSGRYLCYNLYETKDQRYMSLAALEPKFFQTLCELLKRPDLMEHQYDRIAENTVAYQELQAQFRSRTQKEWVEILADVDTCCEPVLNLADVPEHPHFKSHKLFEDVAVGDSKLTRARAVPALQQHGASLSPAAFLGEHTREILMESGYTETDIAALCDDGVVRIKS